MLTDVQTPFLGTPISSPLTDYILAGGPEGAPRRQPGQPGGGGALPEALPRKGTNGVSTNGVTANVMFFLTEGPFGYSR